jgi:hypothetical protein
MAKKMKPPKPRPSPPLNLQKTVLAAEKTLASESHEGASSIPQFFD